MVISANVDKFVHFMWITIVLIKNVCYISGSWIMSDLYIVNYMDRNINNKHHNNSNMKKVDKRIP